MAFDTNSDGITESRHPKTHFQVPSLPVSREGEIGIKRVFIVNS